MKDLDRINYKGFTKKYVLQRLKIVLKTENLVLSQSGGMVMEHENQIIEIDCTPFLNLDSDIFISAVYRNLLEREPDNEEFSMYKLKLCLGMPREAMIYNIAISLEFANRFKIKYINNYKRKYQKYILKSKIKALPIIGWCIKFRRMVNFYDEWRVKEEERRVKEEERHIMNENLMKKTDHLQQQVDYIVPVSVGLLEKTDYFQRQIDNMVFISTCLSEKIDSLHQKLDKQMELPSTPEYLVVNGWLEKNSYLDHANSLLKAEAPEKIGSDNFYQLHQALFRGSESDIKKHQKYYIDYIFSNTVMQKSTGKYFLDAGCGRGEFLSLLKERNINSIGIDIDKINTDYLTKKGFSVYCTDIIEYLNSIEDNELIGLSSFQVIEHLSKEYVNEMIVIAKKKISENGIILLETNNPYCYSQYGSFYLDNTHISWHSPDNLKLYLEYVGFRDVKIIYYAPVPPQQASKVDTKANYIGYAIIASV